MNISITAKRLMELFGKAASGIAAQLFPEIPEDEQLRIIDGCCRLNMKLFLKPVHLSMKIWRDSQISFCTKYPALYREQLPGRIY